MSIWNLPGQGSVQLGELGLAFVLSALIGLEREIRHKAAGLRTYTLVGFAAALIMLVSKYGFMNILANDRVVLDPSRVAAQIVTGIGFIGGGLIFVRRDSVRGLTTAAVVWLTAAIGMACGAGLLVLALTVAAGHFTVVLGFPYIARRLPRSHWAPSALQVSYEDGRGILRDILMTCTRHNFSVSRLEVDRVPPSIDRPGGGSSSSSEAHFEDRDTLESTADAAKGPPNRPSSRIVTVNMELQGIGSVSNLATVLADIPGVTAVNAGDVNVATD